MGFAVIASVCAITVVSATSLVPETEGYIEYTVPSLIESGGSYCNRRALLEELAHSQGIRASVCIVAPGYPEFQIAVFAIFVAKMVYSPVYMPLRRHSRILGKPVLQRPPYHGIRIDQAVRFRDYLAVDAPRLSPVGSPVVFSSLCYQLDAGFGVIFPGAGSKLAYNGTIPDVMYSTSSFLIPVVSIFPVFGQQAKTPVK